MFMLGMKNASRVRVYAISCNSIFFPIGNFSSTRGSLQNPDTNRNRAACRTSSSVNSIILLWVNPSPTRTRFRPIEGVAEGQSHEDESGAEGRGAEGRLGPNTARLWAHKGSYFSIF
jgi:hypothetical protein